MTEQTPDEVSIDMADHALVAGGQLHLDQPEVARHRLPRPPPLGWQRPQGQQGQLLQGGRGQCLEGLHHDWDQQWAC